MTNSEIRSAWDVEADQLQKVRAYTLDEARNYTICVWLIGSGDTRPYCDWINRGHVPSTNVMKVIARMMHEGEDDHVGFVLTAKKRKGGRGPIIDREKLIRNALVAGTVERLIRVEGMKYEVAIKEVAELVHQSEPNVRRVYDKSARRR